VHINVHWQFPSALDILMSDHLDRRFSGIIASSPSFRLLLVSSLLIATLAIIAVTCVLLWPAWQKHRAVSALNDAIKRNDEEAVHA
jgi:hypothetical protein